MAGTHTGTIRWEGGQGHKAASARQCLELVSHPESDEHRRVELREHKAFKETWALSTEEEKIDSHLKTKFPSLDDDQRINLIRGYERFTPAERATAAAAIQSWNEDYGKSLLYSPMTKADQMFHEGFVEMFHGTDKWGHPVHSLDFSTVDSNKLVSVLKDPTILVRIQSRKLLASAYLKFRISKCVGRRIRKNIFIMNLDGLSLWSFYKHQAIVKGVMDVGLKYFPETLLKVYLVNPSRVFYMVWKIAKIWLDPVTLSNIKVVKSLKQAQEMWKEDGIDIEALPKKLGGSGKGAINISAVVQKITATAEIESKREPLPEQPEDLPRARTAVKRPVAEKDIDEIRIPKTRSAPAPVAPSEEGEGARDSSQQRQAQTASNNKQPAAATVPAAVVKAEEEEVQQKKLARAPSVKPPPFAAFGCMDMDADEAHPALAAHVRSQSNLARERDASENSSRTMGGQSSPSQESRKTSSVYSHERPPSNAASVDSKHPRDSSSLISDGDKMAYATPSPVSSVSEALEPTRSMAPHAFLHQAKRAAPAPVPMPPASPKECLLGSPPASTQIGARTTDDRTPRECKHHTTHLDHHRAQGSSRRASRFTLGNSSFALSNVRISRSFHQGSDEVLRTQPPPPSSSSAKDQRKLDSQPLPQQPAQPPAPSGLSIASFLFSGGSMACMGMTRPRRGDDIDKPKFRPPANNRILT